MSTRGKHPIQFSTPDREHDPGASATDTPRTVLGDFVEQTLCSHEDPQGRRAGLPWYRQAFQQDYLDLYLHRDLAEAARAVRFLARALSLERDQRILDLCCGPGRHLVFLGQYVREVVGVDLSRALLTRAREHWAAMHEECGMRKAEGGERVNETVDRGHAGAGIDYDYEHEHEHEKKQAGGSKAQALLVQGDMRRIPLAAGAVDRVVNLFTSFGYFEREDDNAAVLGEIARVLRPGGLLALDHINREAMLAHLRPQSERGLPDGRQILEKRRFDADTHRVIKDVICTEPGGGVKAWNESVRVYEPGELEAMLGAAELDPVARYGDYDGGPWRPDAPRLILVARRK